jgi:type VI protein secretion system component VasF
MPSSLLGEAVVLEVLGPLAAMAVELRHWLAQAQQIRKLVQQAVEAAQHRLAVQGVEPEALRDRN